MTERGRPATASDNERDAPSRRPTRAALAEFVLFLASSGAFQASRLLTNLAAAALLSPSAFGTWGLASTVLSYTTYANLGVLSGANRRIPIELGSGKRSDAARTESVAFAAASATGVAAAVTALVIGLAIGGPWQQMAIPLAVAIAFQQLYLFFQVSLRGRLELNRASLQQVILAVLFPVVGIPLVRSAGAAGLAGAQAVAFAVGALLVFTVWRRSTRPRSDPVWLITLIREGVPIMLVGLAFAALTSVDRWIIATLGGAEALGHYTLAATISSSMLFVTVVVSQQLYPRLAHRYGAGDAATALFRSALLQGLLSASLLAPAAVAVVVFGQSLVSTLFPQYEPAVTAMQILTLGFVALSLGNGFANFLVTLGRTWILLLLEGALIIGVGIIGIGLFQGGHGLAGVALAMAAGSIGYTVATAMMARRAARG